MNLDPLSPVAPARVRALVLPIGRSRKSRFDAFVERLHSEHVVHLRDVTPSSRPNRTMFSPLAFPDGAILYDLVTHAPPASHLALSPFDLYREPLVLLAIADGAELASPGFSRRHSFGGGRTPTERNVRALCQDLEDLRDAYPRVLVHQVLIFDFVADPDRSVAIPEGIVTVPPAAQQKRTTIKAVLCDVSSLLLAEMTGLARSVEAMSFIESPGQAPGAVAASANSSRAHLQQQQQQQQRQDGGDESKHARRKSQFVTSSAGLSRSASAGDRSHVRMSMPPVLPLGSSSNSSNSNSNNNPPTTFDDMWQKDGDQQQQQQQQGAPPSRPGTAEGFRTQSQDRVSVQGFGSGGVSERWRNKGRSRVQIVVGSLYLQAGRWGDAIRELADAAAVAKSVNDHVWHGKALELMLVALLLLAWAGLEFQVPVVLLPPPEKASSSSSSSSSLASAMQEAEARDPNQPRWLRQLQVLLPDLVDRILGLYSRISAEHLPPLALSEATVRLAKALAALHVAEGRLGRRALDLMVEGIAPEGEGEGQAPHRLAPRPSVGPPTCAHVASLLFRAFPASPSELLTTVDRVVILGGIASALGLLGLRRKRALVLRELVAVLTTGLVEARTRGAADVGIHPAAGLVAGGGLPGRGGGLPGRGGGSSSGALQLGEADIEQGLDAFLDMLLQTYGVVSYDPGAHRRGEKTTMQAHDHDDHDVDNNDAAVMVRIQRQSAARIFGMRAAKLDILRSSLRFAEALPDPPAVLRFASDLLRTAGSGIAPRPRSGGGGGGGGGGRQDASPAIGKDEQVRLVTTIARATQLARRLGLAEQDGASAEYWDEFLVRGVRLEPLATARAPVAHDARSVLPEAAAAKTSSSSSSSSSQELAVDPFIYNPFLKAAAAASSDKEDGAILVAGEPVVFRVTLQNPYDIEVEVERIRLAAEGVPFESHLLDESGAAAAAAAAAGAGGGGLVLGPYRTQTVRLSGKALAAGELQITGAVVKVRGCRERRFPIFAEAWAPESEPKVKAIGLAALDRALDAAATVAVGEKTQSSSARKGAPKPERLALRVIAEQPVVVVRSTTLAQSAAMVLEGERQTFAVTLENLSDTTPVDFLVFSFRDSTQEPLQAALQGRDATAAERYECELSLARKPALRLRGDGGPRREKRYLAPGATATFEFEMLGKPGLTSATIQADYAHLGDERAAGSDDKVYTRRVSLELTVTVNASVEVARVDVLAPPAGGLIPPPLWARSGGAVEDPRRLSPDEYFLLALDLRNAWPSDMLVRLEVADAAPDSSSASGAAAPPAAPAATVAVVEARILPGHTSRLVVPARRIRVEDPHAPIPTLHPSRQRQFVVSAKVSPEAEKAMREAFWYREKLLECLQATWTALSTSSDPKQQRSGTIELRGVRLGPRMLDCVKVEDVGVEIAVGDGDDFGAAAATTDVGTDEFVPLRVRVTNRSARPVYPLLRVVPSLRHRPRHAALDLARRFAAQGSLQQALPVLAGGASAEWAVSVVALCRGAFEVTASVEETRICSDEEEQGQQEQDHEGERRGGGRPRSNTATMMRNAALGAKERRIWYARRPCRIVVRDRE